jgi:Tfp pilus assembly protein PilX
VTFRRQAGYVIPSILGFLLLISLATISALNIAATHIRMIQSESDYLKTVISAERSLIKAERNLNLGLNEVEVETYKPKHFRNKSGISSQHYKLTSSAKSPLTHVQLQSTIRIDTPHTPSKNKTKKIERLHWKKL